MDWDKLKGQPWWLVLGAVAVYLIVYTLTVCATAAVGMYAYNLAAPAFAMPACTYGHAFGVTVLSYMLTGLVRRSVGSK